MNWSLLRRPAFRALWWGRLLSWVGSGVGPVAIVFAAIDLGAGVTVLGIVIACRSIPNVLLVLFGGAVADRAPKWAVAVTASAVSAASLAAPALLLATGDASLPLLAGAAAVSGAGSAFFAPATGALLRDVVEAEQLRDATILNRLGMNIGLVAGTALGGELVDMLSPEIALAVGSLLFTAAIPVFAGLPRRALGAIRGGSFAHDLREGIAFVLRTRWLRSTLALLFVAQFAFAGGVQVLGPFAADASFGRSLWGFAGAVQTVGLVVGAVVAGNLRGRLRLATATLGVAGMALPLGVLALILTVDPVVIDPLHWFFWLSVALAGASIGLEIFTVPLDVMIQRQVPRPYLARAYACLTLASLAGMPVGELVVGPVVGLIGAPLTLCGLGTLVLLAAAAVAVSPRVRRLDRSKA
ncbi:transmembrane secretion effector [Frondihabitans sp. PhB188]|uniref:MFS transporter n=1 Tax=Frondihabitans sp. PhB188 TaxID=2485200 RepID=UPI000F48F362|nr:MFS transporter [Frondihabitans sp. PhB188]ROQ37565.1 transmembrane secretion effector [Frondihabitans sp. PhB188]